MNPTFSCIILFRKLSYKYPLSPAESIIKQVPILRAKVRVSSVKVSNSGLEFVGHFRRLQ
jgi:hypothetical protein